MKILRFIFYTTVVYLIIVFSCPLNAQKKKAEIKIPTKIYYQAEGILTNGGELRQGIGISVIITGPKEVFINKSAKFSIEIKPGSGWENSNGAYAKPKSIYGLGMSQIVVCGNSKKLNFSNPKLNIDGKSILEDIIVGLITKTIPISSFITGTEDILPWLSKMLLNSYLQSLKSNYNGKQTSQYIGASPNLGEVNSVVNITASVGGMKNISDIMSASKVVLDFEVTFNESGEQSFFVMPDIRFEAKGAPGNNMITTVIPYLSFEYRDGIMVNISVERNVEVSHEGKNEIIVSCGDNILYFGKTYHTVKIGRQCWLKENLDVGSFIKSTNDKEGTIMHTSNDQTNNGLIEKYCFYDNPVNCMKYGGLYQWAEAMQYSVKEGARGICPTGWHIPTLAEFKSLKLELNDNDGIVNHIKGFTTLLSGYCYRGIFSSLDNYASFWSSTGYDANDAAYGGEGKNDEYLWQMHNNKSFAFSVRCIKD